MIDYFCVKGILPYSMNIPVASMSVLVKSGKGSLECFSFRPISLLNFDSEVITKLIARGRGSITLAYPDQMGFIKNWYSPDNVRRLFDVINHLNEHKTPPILLSLDAEKAFNRVE